MSKKFTVFRGVLQTKRPRQDGACGQAGARVRLSGRRIERAGQCFNAGDDTTGAATPGPPLILIHPQRPR